MTAPFVYPSVKRYALTQARVLGRSLPKPEGPLDFDGFATVDILVDEGAIAKIAPAGAVDFGDAPQVALSGRIVLPLSSTPTPISTRATSGGGNAIPSETSRARSPPHRRPFGQLDAADVAARMEFSLRSAYAYGTTALRTHIDSVGAQTRISWPVFAEARERWRDRITLQAAPIFSVDFALDRSHMADIEAMLDAHGTGILGAVTYMVPRLREGLKTLFELAERKGWELDFHVDESADPARALAQDRRRHGDRAPVCAPHSGRPLLLARAAGGRRAAKDDRRRRPRGGSASSPCRCATSSFRIAMPGRTPRWRGVTALHELKAAGVNVMIASDNTRDPFYAFGDLDMMETWREGVRILHLDYPFADWAPAVAAAPAGRWDWTSDNCAPAGAPT